jgi:predicted transcriptional regulator
MADAPEIGPLEMQAVGLVEAHQPATVAEIQKYLKQGGSDLAYTTVMTVLARLEKKGILTRRKEGKRFVYSVGRSAALLKTSLLARIRRALFRGESAGPIAALIDADELSTDELRELRRKIDAKLRKQGR